MTEDKLIEIFDKATKFINRVVEIQNKYIDKINGYLDELEKLLNNIQHYSEKFIKIKINKIISDINKTLNSLKKKITNIISQINAWYDDQINTIKTQIILFSFAKLGLPTTKELASEAAKVIPHPALGIPNLDIVINLPSISELTIGNISVSIPRIPKIEI